MTQKSFSFNSGNEINSLSLEQPNQTLRTVLVGICKFTPKGRLFFTNTYFAQLLGYSSPEELLSHVYSLTKQLYADPTDWVKLKCLLETLGEILNYECKLVRKDGSIVWVSINAQVVLGDNGQLKYIQCFIRDINTHKRFEETLESEQEFLSTLVDNLHEAIVIKLIFIFTPLVKSKQRWVLELKHGKARYKGICQEYFDILLAPWIRYLTKSASKDGIEGISVEILS